jgi:hypothetical protein
MESRLDFRPAAPCRSSHTRHGRAFVAGLLALLSLVLSIDLHLPGQPGDAHELLLVQAGSTYVPEASHPDQPVHIEAATAQERPSCSACILRLQTLAAFLSAESAGVPLAAQDRLQLPAAFVELQGLSSPRSARAPPRA